MSRRMPWTERIVALCEESPRTREELVALVAPLVPAGRAYRRAEANRIHAARYAGRQGDVPRMHGDRETARKAGQRGFVTNSIAKLSQAGTLVQTQPGVYAANGLRSVPATSRESAST